MLHTHDDHVQEDHDEDGNLEPALVQLFKCT